MVAPRETMQIQVRRGKATRPMMTGDITQLSEELQTGFAILIILTKPDDDLPRALEDLVHQLDLLIPFLDAVLTDAYLIDPKGDNVIRISKPMQSFKQCSGHREALAITLDDFAAISVTPSVRESIVGDLLRTSHERIDEIDRDALVANPRLNLSKADSGLRALQQSVPEVCELCAGIGRTSPVCKIHLIALGDSPILQCDLVTSHLGQLSVTSVYSSMRQVPRPAPK